MHGRVCAQARMVVASSLIEVLGLGVLVIYLDWDSLFALTSWVSTASTGGMSSSEAFPGNHCARKPWRRMLASSHVVFF